MADEGKARGWAASTENIGCTVMVVAVLAWLAFMAWLNAGHPAL